MSIHTDINRKQAFAGQLRHTLYMTPIAYIAIAIYCAAIQNYMWMVAALTGSIIGFGVGGYALGKIQTPSQKLSLFTSTTLRLLVAWLAVICQVFAGVIFQLVSEFSVSAVLFEVVSAVTTSGIGPIGSEIEYHHPLSLILAVASGVGGYLSILTGYAALKLILGGFGIRQLPETYGEEDHNINSHHAASVEHFGSDHPRELREIFDNSSPWHFLPKVYILGIIVAASLLSASGLPALKALTWGVHAIATAGPLPDLNRVTEFHSPTSFRSIILLGAMFYGAAIIPVIVLWRLLPYSSVLSLVLFVALLVCITTIFGHTTPTTASFLDQLMINAGVALTGPSLPASWSLSIVPALTLTAIGVLPCGTGGGLKVTNLKSLGSIIVHNLVHQTSASSSRGGPHHKIIRTNSPPRSIRTIGFVFSCWIIVVTAGTAAISIETGDFITSLTYTISAVSNSSGAIHALYHNTTLPLPLSDPSLLILSFVMLCGRLDLMIPLLIILWRTQFKPLK